MRICSLLANKFRFLKTKTIAFKTLKQLKTKKFNNLRSYKLKYVYTFTPTTK